MISTHRNSRENKSEIHLLLYGTTQHNKTQQSQAHMQKIKIQFPICDMSIECCCSLICINVSHGPKTDNLIFKKRSKNKKTNQLIIDTACVDFFSILALIWLPVT